MIKWIKYFPVLKVHLVECFQPVYVLKIVNYL